MQYDLKTPNEIGFKIVLPDSQKQDLGDVNQRINELMLFAKSFFPTLGYTRKISNDQSQVKYVCKLSSQDPSWDVFKKIRDEAIIPENSQDSAPQF